MEWEILRYGHIPGIKLEPDQTVPLGNGELRSVPFDEWSTFVGRHVEQSERYYEKTRPTFYVDTLVIDDADGVDIEAELKQPFRIQLTRIQTALIYTLSAVLPNPLKSTRYLLSRVSKERFRDIGERDIEWMIYGAWDHDVAIPMDHMEPLGRMLAHLNELGYGPETPELQRVLDVIRMAAEPPLRSEDVVMHATIALEDVLNPDADRPLGRVFARRGAVLAAGNYEALEEAEDILRALYRVRSKCLHGEDPSAALKSLERWYQKPLAPAFVICGLVGEVLGQYLQRYGPSEAVASLLREVDAVVDRESYQRFRDGIQRGWFHL